MISAGAGSGKTRVITFKIAYMIREMGLQPEEVLALTFTNKAANEMKERVQALTGVEGSRLWISTFHSFGLRLLKTHLSNGKSLSVLDREDQKALLKEIAASMKLKLDSDELKKVVAEISEPSGRGFSSKSGDAHQLYGLPVYRPLPPLPEGVGSGKPLTLKISSPGRLRC